LITFVFGEESLAVNLKNGYFFMKNNFKKLLYKQVFLCNPQKKKKKIFKNKKTKAQKEMELIF